MKQSEIWLINLNPTIGEEIKKIRPAKIVNDDALGKLPLKVVVPVTDWKVKFNIVPWIVLIKPNLQNGLSKKSSADCFQVRSISEKRFIRKLGKITQNQLNDLKVGLSKVLSIDD